MTKIITFTTNNFIQANPDEKYIATFSAATLGFSGVKTYRLAKCLKSIDSGYQNVLLSYEINSSGDLLIYSDEPFSGRLIAITDT